MNKAEAMKVIDSEIRWCEANPDKNLSPDYRDGFVNGLIQAKYLLNGIAQSNQQGVMAEDAGKGG